MLKNIVSIIALMDVLLNRYIKNIDKIVILFSYNNELINFRVRNFYEK